MNLYYSLGRFYVQFDTDNWHGIRFACGRWPAESPIGDDVVDDGYAARTAIPDDPEAHGIVHVGAQSFETTVEPLNPVNQSDEE